MRTQVKQLLISAAQVSCSMGFGDLCCQFLEQNKKEFANIDLERTTRMFITGALVSGPWNHCQYRVLEKIAPGNTGLMVFKKVVGAAAMAPISISLMFSSVLLLQNKGDQVQEKISQDLLTTWCVGAMYWPFVLGINFRYVSLTHRPLVGALAGSAWNIYNSFQANKKTATANS
jgi:hypothetical protein